MKINYKWTSNESIFKKTRIMFNPILNIFCIINKF